MTDLYASPSSRVNVRNAMAGRFEASRIAKCMVSKVQPWAVHSLSARSMSSWMLA